MKQNKQAKTGYGVGSGTIECKGSKDNKTWLQIITRVIAFFLVIIGYCAILTIAATDY